MRARLKMFRRMRQRVFTPDDIWRHAWFSREMNEEYGHCVYRRALGDVLKITELTCKPVQFSNWKDAKYVGIVKRDGFVRRASGTSRWEDGQTFHMSFCYPSTLRMPRNNMRVVAA